MPSPNMLSFSFILLLRMYFKQSGLPDTRKHWKKNDEALNFIHQLKRRQTRQNKHNWNGKWVPICIQSFRVNWCNIASQQVPTFLTATRCVFKDWWNVWANNSPHFSCCVITEAHRNNVASLCTALPTMLESHIVSMEINATANSIRHLLQFVH